MTSFWNQMWKQYDRIKEFRGCEAAQAFLKKVVDRLDDNREAGV